MKRIAAIAICLGAAQSSLTFAVPVSAAEQGAPSPRTIRLGKTVFKESCSGCHKWHGGGGGGYGGAALSLRTTQLDLDQTIEVIRCGRPSTGMPQHVADAYEGGQCYGIAKDTPGIEFPMKANTMLRPDEVAAVAAYVKNNLQGEGEPTLGECEDYWGPNSHNCRDYQPRSSPSAETSEPR